MTYRHFDLDTGVGPVGAVVSGVDLATVEPEVVAELYEAWLAHRVLFFHQQDVSPAQQAAFAASFGELDRYPFMQPLPGHPHVIPIIKEPDAELNFGGGWHTDTSYLPRPPKATVLYALETPDGGGDTLFADASAAYDDLSTGMKHLVGGLRGIYSARVVHGKQGAYSQAPRRADLGRAYGGDEVDAEREVEHPIIRTHAETRRRSIYCSPAHTWCIKDMTREESLPLIEYLLKHATQERYVTRFSWAPGSLAIWDNRCLYHYALNDYPGQRRHMHRVIVKGETPI